MSQTKSQNLKKEVTRPNIFLGFAVYRDIYGETVTDLWNALVTIPDYNFQLSINSSANIGFNRNRLVEQFLESDCDYLVFIDQDMSYRPVDLKRLIDQLHSNPEAGIVSGFYVKRDGTFTPLGGWMEDDYQMKDMIFHLETLRDNKGQIIECDLLPTGFMAIRREVFDTIKKPYFHIKVFDDGKEWSSDSVFCNKVQKEGWKLYLDLGIEVGHIGNYTYHPRDMYAMLDDNLKFWNVHYAKKNILEKYEPNSEEYWDAIWTMEQEYGLHRNKMEQVYNLIDSFVQGRDNTILDLGCGTGNLAYMLHTLGNNVYCADISNKALELCEEQGIKNTIRLDIEKDKLGDDYRNKFDYIVSTELIEHVNNLDNFFSVVKFGLKPKGAFIVTCPNDRLSPEEEPEHVRTVDKDLLFKLLEVFEHRQVGIFGDYLVGMGSDDGTALNQLVGR